MKSDEGPWDEFREVRRDHKVDEVESELRKFFEEKERDVFYMRQLEVKYEKKFFHWVTGRAINKLIDEGFLRNEKVSLKGPTWTRFVFNRGHRYYKRQINRSLKVIREYSNAGRECGKQAEVLFMNGLALEGFVLKGKYINKYRGKKWDSTGHDLDFIINRDGVSYGCEVKNTFGYIDYDEFNTKLDLCDFLKIRPVFIMRNSPKTYIWEIIKRGGFAMIFEVQIYPFGYEKLVNEIKEVLGMPVDCPSAIPEGIIKRFVNWHERQITS